MRIGILLAALALAITAAASAYAQQVTFPAPAFVGSGEGWSIRLDTRPDGDVAYSLTPPGQGQAKQGLLTLGASNKPRPGTYVLNNLQGESWVAIAIVPFAQGQSCQEDLDAPYATYTIRVATANAFVLDGCGYFTQ